MKNPHGLTFLIFLSGLAALPPFAIDMALPGLNKIAASLHTDLRFAGLTLSLFMVGFAVTPIIYGPLSDRYGRRPVLAAGLALFCLGSLAAAVAPGILSLLLARLLEGAGAGVGTAVAFAIVRDTFQGDEARAKLSYVQMVTGFAPMIAPTIGAFLLLAGWRMIYGTLAIGGITLLLTVVFGFQESNLHPQRGEKLFAQVFAGYRLLFSRRVGLGYALVFGTSFGVLFSYVAGSPLVFMGHFGLSSHLYGLIFASTACGIMGGAFTNTLLTRSGTSAATPLGIGILLCLLTSFAMLGLLAAGHANTITLVPLLVLSAYAFGLIAPNAAHGALQALPEIAGITGGVLTTMQMSIAVLASAIVATSFANLGLAAMLLPMAGFAILTTGIYIFMVLPALKPGVA